MKGQFRAKPRFKLTLLHASLYAAKKGTLFRTCTGIAQWTAYVIPPHGATLPGQWSGYPCTFALPRKLNRLRFLLMPILANTGSATLMLWLSINLLALAMPGFLPLELGISRSKLLVGNIGAYLQPALSANRLDDALQILIRALFLLMIGWITPQTPAQLWCVRVLCLFM